MSSRDIEIASSAAAVCPIKRVTAAAKLTPSGTSCRLRINEVLSGRHAPKGKQHRENHNGHRDVITTVDSHR